MKHVKRGQPVTLCTKHTTTPSIIPPGKHVLSVSKSQWLLSLMKMGRLTAHYLYSCSKGSCIHHSSKLITQNYTHYLNISYSCLTISNVQGKEQYSFQMYFDPSHLLKATSVYFFVTIEGMCVCVHRYSNCWSIYGMYLEPKKMYYVASTLEIYCITFIRHST